MRRLPGLLLAATAAAASALALTAGPALAAPPPAAPVVDVLTFGAVGPGGPNVPVGHVLTSSLPAGANATFLTGGGIGTTCTASTIKATVLANPPAAGVATTRIIAQTFGACTSTIPGVTAVSVMVNNLPYMMQFSDSPGFPVKIFPAGPPVQTTITETIGGAPVACVWRPAAGAYNGNYFNGGNQLALKHQQMQLVGGPVGPCAGVVQFYSVLTYRPVVDSSVIGSPPVFVN